MKTAFWILLIAPLVAAMPATEDTSTVPFKNGSLPVLVPKRTIESIANQIASKKPDSYNDLIQYSKDQKIPFNAHLEEIIEKVYENANNDVDAIEQIMPFTDALTEVSQSARVYIKLYKLMESNKEIAFSSAVKIAFKIKQLSSNNHAKIESEVKKEMEELKAKVPYSVRSIIWGQVCIKNALLDGYLHDEVLYDNSRRLINLSRQRNLWVFESNDNASSFRIKNVKTNQYLFAGGDDDAYDALKGRVFTWRGNLEEITNELWLLEDLQFRENRFLIKNKLRNEYLNAEQLPEPTEKYPALASELDRLSQMDRELANKIKDLLEYGKDDRMQLYSSRQKSRGNNPEWLLIDSKNCKSIVKKST